jgi:N-acetylglucosamine-6-phosphate deacetylase
MRELLNGVIDVHVHGSPSVAPRMETWEFLEEMDRAGYRAVGLKEHFMPTAGAAQVFNRKRGPSGTQVIGSIVLNAAVGGLICSRLRRPA